MGLSLSHQNAGSLEDLLFDRVPIFESVDEVFDSGFEFLSSPPHVVHPDRQHELESGSFAEGAVVEVPIRKNSVEPIGVSIARLVQNGDIF